MSNQSITYINVRNLNVRWISKFFEFYKQRIEAQTIEQIIEKWNDLHPFKFVFTSQTKNATIRARNFGNSIVMEVVEN